MIEDNGNVVSASSAMFDELRLLLERALVTDNSLIRQGICYGAMSLVVSLEAHVKGMENRLEEILDGEV